MQGDFGRARDLIGDARTLYVERVRGRRTLMFLALRHAQVEAMAGDDLTPAVDELRTALGLARDLGEPDVVAETAAHLSRLLSAQGSPEAEGFARLSVEAAPSENVTAQALSLAATARVLLNRGRRREAQGLAREAVRLASPGMLNLGADLRADLAEILRVAGQRGAALQATSEAISLYERKGNLVGARRAHALAGQHGTPVP